MLSSTDFFKLHIISPCIVQVFRMTMSLKFSDLLKGMQSNKLKNVFDIYVDVYAIFKNLYFTCSFSGILKHY